MPSPSGSEPRLIRLGVISSAHGVRGQVKIRSFTEYPPDLTAYGTLQDKTGKPYRVTITSHNKEVLIASIEGIESRTDAEALRNIELFVERSALPETKAEEYYHEDLIGLQVIAEDKKPYGQVLSVNNFGAGDIVEIKLISGKEEFLPFNKTIFPVIDIQNRILVVRLPEVIE